MVQQTQSVPVERRVMRMEYRVSPIIERSEQGPCRIVGDPSRFIVDLEGELERIQQHDDSSCLLALIPDARIDARALDRLGARFAANLRSYDSLCRYGANQFLVLLPHVRDSDVARIVRRLRIQVAGYPLKLAEGGDNFVTATTGSVMLDFGSSLQDSIERAVLACRTARKDGGNRDQMWWPGLQAA